jgi:hypothetical protein
MKYMTIIAQPEKGTYKFDALAALDAFSKSIEKLQGHAEGIRHLPENIWKIRADTGLPLIPDMVAEAKLRGVRITILLTDDEPVLADFPRAA